MDTLRHDPAGANSAKKITLSDRDATDTARLLKLLSGTSPDPLTDLSRSFGPSEHSQLMEVVSSHATLIAAAKETLISRRSRGQFLDNSIFSEPAWDILLALYITEESEARHSIARLTEFAGAPATTSLRWISHLEKMGLVCRVPHPNDLRTAFIELTDEARHALDGYFSRFVAMEFAGKC